MLLGLAIYVQRQAFPVVVGAIDVARVTSVAAFVDSVIRFVFSQSELGQCFDPRNRLSGGKVAEAVALLIKHDISAVFRW